MLTTSFHGLIFSILLHKPFFVCLRPESQFAGNNRVINVLSVLGLEDRIVTDDTDIRKMLRKPINWWAIDRKLKVLRRESLRYLTNSLWK